MANSSPPPDGTVDLAAHGLPEAFLDLLAFNFDEAHIWLGDRRMMMIDVAVFGELRRLLIDQVGSARANRELARIGFEAGRRDAALLRERFPLSRSQPDKFVELSPHRFQGITRLKIVKIARGENNEVLSGEWQWQHSVEADAHVAAYGRSAEPTCWMELGYGTGYGFQLYDSLVRYREIGCRAMGNEVCTIIGRSLYHCDDAEEYIEYLDFLKPHVDMERLPKPRRTRHRAFEPKPGPVRAAPTAADAIVGRSPTLSAAKELLESVAGTNATVLISGESGVGKELFTRNLHRLSKRSAKPFVPVNCAAIPDTLIEAELFGVERGAFTGATASRAGRFERANGGTLFLDEIGSLNAAAQVKLLRAIQEREVERVGGSTAIKVDVRIVTASNVALRELVERGEFRRDLFYRLNVFPIHVPPLRERREDIPDLLAHYLAWYNDLHGRDIKRFSFEARQALLNYDYPGNIRELQNLIERAVILTQDDTIGISNLFAYGESLDSELWGLDREGKLSVHRQTRQSTPLGELQRAIERNETMCWPEIEERIFAYLASGVLESVEGNVSAAARRLGMKRHQLEYRLKQSRLPRVPTRPE